MEAKGLCEKCLQFLEDAEEEKGRICACGHKTPYLTSIGLYMAIRLADRIAKTELISQIREVLENSGGLPNTVLVEGVFVTYPKAGYLDRIDFNEEEFFCLPEIEKAGTAILKKLISGKKEELEKITCRPVDPVAAANVIAYLYDEKTGKHADIIIQRISGSGAKEFLLGDDLADPAKRSRVVAEHRTEMVFPIIGGANLEAVESTRTRYAVRVSETVYPLAIVYQASDFDRSKLFIYL